MIKVTTDSGDSKTNPASQLHEKARPNAFPEFITPMLASPADGGFTHKGWIYEPKLDGMRAITVIKDGKVRMYSRRGMEITRQYPELVRQLPSLCSYDAVIDGEIIALDKLGRPSFQQLQQRMNLTKAADIAKLERIVPVYYFVFDMIHVGGFDLCAVPLRERKRIAAAVFQTNKAIRLLDHFTDDGELAFDACIENGFEGIVAKRLESGYEVGRRSPSWVKVKAQQTEDFVIGGFTKGQGSRDTTFGAVLLGYYDQNKNLIYCGSAGSGFDDKLLAKMMQLMTPLHIKKCPFLVRPPEKKEVVWLTPNLVAEVKFMDRTRDEHLRFPVFLRLRDDLEACNVVRVPMLKAQKLSDGQAKPLNPAAQTPGLQASHLLPQTPGAQPPDPLAALDAITQTAKPQAAAADPAAKGKQGAVRKVAAAAPPAVAAVREAQVLYETRYESANETAHESTYEAPAMTGEQLALLAQLEQPGANIDLMIGGNRVTATNLDRELWRSDKECSAVTKRHYLQYLATVAHLMIAHMHGRPLTLIRLPYGVKGRSFYQRHWKAIPEFVDTVRTSDEELLFSNNLPSLIWFAQNRVLEFHTWTTRLDPAFCDYGAGVDDSQLSRPDYLVIDIDVHSGSKDNTMRNAMDSAAFKRAREAAFILRTECQKIGLHPFVKTSGRNGLHIFVPVQTNLDFAVARTLAQTICTFTARQQPDFLSVEMQPEKRGDRVLLDSSPNGRGRSVCTVYSARANFQAGVSAPVSWDELADCQPGDFTIHSMLERSKEKGDLWWNLLHRRCDLKAMMNLSSETV